MRMTVERAAMVAGLVAAAKGVAARVRVVAAAGGGLALGSEANSFGKCSFATDLPRQIAASRLRARPY